MPHKIISKITSSADRVRHIITEETFPEAVSKAKAAGASVAENVTKIRDAAGSTINDTVEKIKAADKPTFSSVKKDAETVVTSGIRQVGEIEWKKELERIKNLDLPIFTKLKPIDWTAEHVRFWGEDADQLETKDWGSAEPHQLVSGPPWGWTIAHNDDGTTTMVQYKDEKAFSADEIVYTTASEPKTGKTDGSVLAHFLEENEKKALLSKLSGDLNEVLKKEEDKLSFEDSKNNESAPAKKKAAKAVAKEPVVTVLGSDEGQVAPLGTEYKKLIRKVAKQAEKNSDVKLYLAGKTYGIGARGTVENIDGNDVNVFDAKDIKKLLAKIS